MSASGTYDILRLCPLNYDRCKNRDAEQLSQLLSQKDFNDFKEECILIFLLLYLDLKNCGILVGINN